MSKILKDEFVGPLDDRIVTVCAWCCPGESILELYPHLRGNVKISHGICSEHKAQMLAAINSLPGKEAV